ncbi:MAG: DNA/RNA nuclease SfsA [Syntrophus sp. (in: bacteria)]|nr:DNA/RNA nuclease SfsA [Syntrophus sp. (in: bacteria)]
MHILRLFDEIHRARFIARPNRFIVTCELKGRVINAFLPNPGRLQELLFTDSTIYLTREKTSGQRKTLYTAVAVERDHIPVMLHTHRTNDVARYILEQGKVPGLEKALIKRAEVRVGHSRFDFLLHDDQGDIYLEVKSCTLVGRRVAMFPDAITARGARHLQELEALSKQGTRAAVLIVVHWPCAEIFMPDYHTDLFFAQTILAARRHVRIIPVAVEWQHDLSLKDDFRPLHVPWSYIEKEARDRGSYLLILYLEEGIAISVGSLGKIYFREGFYIYAGSAMANLSKRMERHRRLRKQHHWHIDELRAVGEVHALLAVRSSERLECPIADALSAIADWTVPHFGSSDCSCPTHLFGMARDPIESRVFQGLLQYFRMDRYDPLPPG